GRRRNDRGVSRFPLPLGLRTARPHSTASRSYRPSMRRRRRCVVSSVGTLPSRRRMCYATGPPGLDVSGNRGQGAQRSREGQVNGLQQRVLSSLDRDELVRMTREIVEISSPPGQEQGVSEYLAEKFQALGLRVLTQEVEPGRSNVIGTLAGSGRGKSLMITGHMDTTPGIYERILVEDDWLFGPGATNMKCCFTAAYAAAKMLRQAGVQLKGDLLIAAVVGEIECGPVQDSRQMYSGPAYRGAGMGTEFMLRHGVVADMAIIGEPTGLRVQCGNEGYIYAKITTFGKVIHTQAKHSGVNALEKMMKVMQ